MANKLRLLALGTMVSLIAIAPVSCSQQRNSKIENSINLMKEINNTLMFEFSFGELNAKGAEKIFNELETWNNSDALPKMFFSGSQQHKAFNSSQTQINYAFIFDGTQRIVNNNDTTWHKLQDKWIDDFSAVKQSVFEAWDGLSEDHGMKFDVTTFKNAIAMLTFQFDKNNNKIGKLYKIAKSDNQILISDNPLMIFDFEPTNINLKDFWNAHKNDLNWQNEHQNKWNLLLAIQKKEGWT